MSIFLRAAAAHFAQQQQAEYALNQRMLLDDPGDVLGDDAAPLPDPEEEEEEAAAASWLGGIQLIMILGMFLMAILAHDLRNTIAEMSALKTKRNLLILFRLAWFFYVCEFIMLLGTVISALCPVALWILGICHYSIKVIVSYSYSVRMELALKGKMKFSKKTIASIINSLQVAILITALSNLAKVFLTYSSKEVDGACVFDLGGFWAYLDEIMFGVIDLLTLCILFSFYWTANLSEKTSFVIGRILFMSAMTMVATVFAIIVNVEIPSMGLASSVMDITTDILTMMLIYTRPDMHKYNKRQGTITSSMVSTVSSVEEQDEI